MKMTDRNSATVRGRTANRIFAIATLVNSNHAASIELVATPRQMRIGCHHHRLTQSVYSSLKRQDSWRTNPIIISQHK
jgi:hypothetical protein